MQSSRNSNSVGAVLNRQFRNYQVCQQCLLLGLLNQYGEIHISKAKKKTNVTLPFLTIEKIIFKQNDEIEINKIIKQRCLEQKEFYLKSGIPLKTVERRMKNNKIISINFSTYFNRKLSHLRIKNFGNYFDKNKNKHLKF